MITKYAGVEIKVMLAHHAAIILKWCNQHVGMTIDKPTKQAISDVVARMYELVGALPEDDTPDKPN